VESALCAPWILHHHAIGARFCAEALVQAEVDPTGHRPWHTLNEAPAALAEATVEAKLVSEWVNVRIHRDDEDEVGGEGDGPAHLAPATALHGQLAEHGRTKQVLVAVGVVVAASSLEVKVVDQLYQDAAVAPVRHPCALHELVDVVAEAIKQVSKSLSRVGALIWQHHVVRKSATRRHKRRTQAPIMLAHGAALGEILGLDGRLQRLKRAAEAKRAHGAAIDELLRWAAARKGPGGDAQARAGKAEGSVERRAEPGS